MKRILLIVFIAILAFGCASKRYAKKGKALEKAGLYVDAADMYYKSARANQNNVDAKIGLRSNGQYALEKKIASFVEEYKAHNVKTAVYSYEDALAYLNKVKSVGVELEIPNDAKQYYQDIKNEYLDTKYNEAISALDREDFTLALTAFEEIHKLNSNYRDVNSQMIIARYEPVYRLAYDALNNGKYRSAYYSFDKVLKGSKGQYKEADILQKEAREKAMITIAVLPFESSYFAANQLNSFSNKLISDIKSQRSPFIRFKDYNSVKTKSGQYIGNGININAARAAGIKAVLIGKVSQYREYSSRNKVSKKDGYIRHVKTVKDKEGKSHKEKYYTKDVYYEYTRYNSVDLAIEYQLISTETGDVMSTNSYDKHVKDAVRYAVYKGSIKNLVPGTWKSIRYKSKNDKVYDNKSSVRKLHRLFRARKTPYSNSQLSVSLQNEITSSIANEIVKYNPE